LSIQTHHLYIIENRSIQVLYEALQPKVKAFGKCHCKGLIHFVDIKGIPRLFYIMIYQGRIWFSLMVMMFLLSSCTVVQKRPAPTTEERHVVLPVKEQQVRATEAFKDVLELVENSQSRLDVVPEMEKRYMDIITRYPDAPLTQEIYWMLVKMYLRDFDPPRLDDAEQIYRRFIKRYPDSPFRVSIEDVLSRFYKRNRMWDKIIQMNGRRAETFMATGRLDKPYLLLLYADALEHLNRKEDALSIYRGLIKNLPRSSTARIAQKRLDALKE